MNEDFVDLRSGNLSSESFWPSFTDIMMVVVMIFLLASAILMVNNWKLIDQLRESIMAEQQASEMIRNTTQENATLEEQLAQAQYEISMLRMQLMQEGEHNSRLAETLADKEEKIILIMSENQQLNNTVNENEQKVIVLTSKLEKADESLQELSSNFEQQSEELKNKRDEIIVLAQQKDSQSNELAALQSEYGSLKVKYDKLIKPARTARGKYVVDVKIQHSKGKTVIRFKDAGDEFFRAVSNDELHTILAKLKKQHHKKLYIKLIIPEDSGLTYNEAWSFMKSLLEKYDYYYQ